MSRFSRMFARAKSEQRAALGVYLTVGDPSVSLTVSAALAALKAGADFIELGAPFSDPSADGPSIQRAMERALARGTTFEDVLSVAEQIRQGDAHAPIVLFGYGNPFFRAQERGLLVKHQASVDGVLIVDVPPEHDHDFASLQGQMARIRLLGPNATPARRQAIASSAEGFVYVVAYAGVTGAAAATDASGLKNQVQAMRALTDVPLCVGFGVKTAADAKALSGVADGVIAGSVFVDALSRAKTEKEADDVVSAIVRDLAAGLR
jgi:tryptophan synthase alpha chain